MDPNLTKSALSYKEKENNQSYKNFRTLKQYRASWNDFIRLFYSKNKLKLPTWYPQCGTKIIHSYIGQNDNEKTLAPKKK